MDKVMKRDELPPVVVNSVRAKSGRDRYGPYKMMFAASPNCLFSQRMEKIEAFHSNSEKFYHHLHHSARVTEVLAGQSRSTERSSLDL